MAQDSSTVGRIALRNTVWLTLLSYLGQLISFVATIFLTRLLGPDVFGWYSLGNFWSSLFNLRSKSGLASSATRQPETTGALLGTAYRLDLILSAISIAISLIGAFVLLQSGYAPQVVIAAVILTVAGSLSAIVGPAGLTLERELQLSRLTLISVFSAIISYVTALLLATAGAGIWSLLVMSLLTAAIGVVGVYLVAKWRVPHIFTWKWPFDWMLARQLLTQGLPAGLSNEAVATITNQFDNFLIGTFVSTTTLGFYDRAYRTSQWSNIFLTMALVRVGYLTFAKVQNDLPRLTHSVRLSFWVLTTIGTPLVLSIFFSAPDLITVFYTEAWLPSSLFLRFLVVYALFSPFISLSSSLAYARGAVRTSVMISAVQAACMIVIGFPLTLWLGAIGTVIAVGISVGAGFALSANYVFRNLPLSLSEVFGTPLIAVCVSVVGTLILLGWPGFAAQSSLLRLLVIVPTTGGLYLASLVALRPAEMNERIRYLIRTFRGQRPAAE